MTHLSDVFKYISHFRHAGHQVGRKVGDMLEVLTYAAIARNDDIYPRLNVEPKLFGFSDAGHKVEFVIFDNPQTDLTGEPVARNGGDITDLDAVIGFIECKKVGVEQTVNGTFKRKFVQHNNTRSYRIPYDEEFTVSFSPRGFDKCSFTVSISSDHKISVQNSIENTHLLTEEIEGSHRLIFTLDIDGNAVLFGENQSLRDFGGTLKNCRILEILSCEGEYALALLNDCLAGPQTPEKAKQSSFVALDVRKRRFDSFDKRAPETELVSVLILTEFSHWEQKSQNMIVACIDKNLFVPDEIIVDAFESFEASFGADFYDRITKENFVKDQDVRRIAISIVAKYDDKIFVDLEDDVHKKMVLEEGVLKFTS